MVTDALVTEPVEGSAVDPSPNVVLMDFKESYCSYAARYWLTDLAKDDPTDSLVRCRIYFALQRAGIAAFGSRLDRVCGIARPGAREAPPRARNLAAAQRPGPCRRWSFSAK